MSPTTAQQPAAALLGCPAVRTQHTPHPKLCLRSPSTAVDHTGLGAQVRLQKHLSVTFRILTQ